MKFKVGQKVRIVSAKGDNTYSKDIGKIGTIKVINKYDYSDILNVLLTMNNGVNWFVSDEDIELVEDDKDTFELHITSDGVTTICVQKKNGKIVDRSQAKLHPVDEFDLKEGIRLCLERLSVPIFERQIEFNNDLYNHKVICVESDTDCFVVGKIYECVDGQMIDSKGYTWSNDFKLYHSFYELNKHLNNKNNIYKAKFIELIEE